MLFLSALLVILYTGMATWRRRKLPESVSAMVYELPQKWQWVWTAWLALVTALMAPALTEAMPSAWYSITSHACIICLAMTAAMPLIPGSHNTAHYGLGIAAGVLSQVCVAIMCSWWLLLWLLFVAVVFYTVFAKKGTIFDGKGVFVMEAVCWMSLMGCLFGELI